MKILNYDQAPRQRMLDSQAEIASILIKMLAAFALFIAGATIFAIISVTEAQGSITGATTDNLLNEEMAEYIVQHPGTYSEQDMQ